MNINSRTIPRREPRFEVKIPVMVSGIAKDGHYFRRSAETLNGSTEGMGIVLDQELYPFAPWSFPFRVTIKFFKFNPKFVTLHPLTTIRTWLVSDLGRWRLFEGFVECRPSRFTRLLSSLSSVPSEFPRWHWITGLRSEPFQRRIVRRMASEPPSETRFDDFIIKRGHPVVSPRQPYVILFLAFGLYFDFPYQSKDLR